MKKIYLTLLSLPLLFIGLNASATVWDINVSNNIFTPSVVNVVVGDTIRWHRLAGTHTTTSTSVPAGAATWDSPMNANVTLFEYIVTVAGNYVYICSFHGGMSGQLVATNSTTGITAPSADLKFAISVSGGSFNFNYNLSKNSNVNLSIIDVTGKLAKLLVSETRNAGNYSENYYFSDLKSGIYIVQLIADNQRITRRIVIE